VESQPRPATRESPSLARRLLYSALPALLLLAVLELAARLLAPPRDALIHHQHENTIQVLGLAALNGTMEFDPDLFWRLKDGLQGFPVRGEIRGQPIDFRVTTRDGMRVVPEPPEPVRLRILALGDSCTFGVGVEDGETWPARLQEILNRDGVGARVWNAGVPGYTAYQGAQLLAKRGAELAPDLVIASFGFNDRDLWSSRSDLETAAQLQRSGWTSLLERSRLVLFLRQLLSPREDAAPPAADERLEGRRRPRLSPQEFRDTLLELARRSAAEGARLVLVAWPYRSQVDQGITGLVRYQALLGAVGRQVGAPVVNVAEAFIADGRPLFLDHVHANALGNEVAARAIEPYAKP
jgi:lysophospholipase L1-like esterase